MNHVILNNSLFTESRLQSLFSDFAHQKLTNPDGYAANLLAWQQVLYALAQEEVFLNAGDLVSNLSVNKQVSLNGTPTQIHFRPLCLDTVLNEILCKDSVGTSEGSAFLVPLQEFMACQHSLYDQSFWNKVTLKNAVFWVFSKTGIYNANYNVGTNPEDKEHKNYLKQMKMVCLPKLEVLSKTRLAQRVYTKSKLQAELGLTNEQMQIYLKYMIRDVAKLAVQEGPLSVSDEEKMQVPEAIIKVKTSPNDTVTANDIAITQLNESIEGINTKIDTLQKKIDQYDSKVAGAMHKKNYNREFVKLLLRTKKSLENSLNSATQHLSNLETLLQNLLLQNDNIEVFKLMSNSKKVLQKLNSELDVDQVDELFANIQGEYDKIEELNETLERFNRSNNATVDEDEIDSELDALESKELAKNLRKISIEQPESSLTDLKNLGAPEGPVEGNAPEKEKNQELVLESA